MHRINDTRQRCDDKKDSLLIEKKMYKISNKSSQQCDHQDTHCLLVIEKAIVAIPKQGNAKPHSFYGFGNTRVSKYTNRVEFFENLILQSFIGLSIDCKQGNSAKYGGGGGDSKCLCILPQEYHSRKCNPKYFLVRYLA